MGPRWPMPCPARSARDELPTRARKGATYAGDDEHAQAGEQRPPLPVFLTKPGAEDQQTAEKHGVGGRHRTGQRIPAPTPSSMTGMAVTTLVTPMTSTNCTRQSTTTGAARDFQMLAAWDMALQSDSGSA